MNRSPVTVTKAMVDAGAITLEQAQAAGQLPRAICHIVFNAMLRESKWSPVARKRPSQLLGGRQLPANPRRPEEFDFEGKRLMGHMQDGRPVYQYKRNFWYLNPPYTKK